MDYITWIKIVAMAVRLVQEPAFEKEFRVHASWSTIDRINLSGNIRTSVLNVDIYRVGSEEKLKSFVFIPWEDMYEGIDATDDLSVVPLLDRIYTVTPFAIVYEIFHKYDVSVAEEEVLGIFTSRFNKLIGYDHCNTVMEKDGGFTMPGQLQVIDLHEYRYYAEINAAIPGSLPVNPDTITRLFPGRMIWLVMVPDKGASRKQWIRGTEPDFGPYFDNIKGELAEILPDTVKKYETQFSMKPLKEEFSEKNEEVGPGSPQTKQDKKISGHDDLQAKKDGKISGENETLNKPGEEGSGDDREQNAEAATPFPWEEPGYSRDEPFPDYTPKLSPDNVLDYMPSLADELGSLPEVSAANLPHYLELFDHYREQARKNPGHWVEGNMLLGAMPKEYKPSSWELMLSETGERIRQIVDQDKPGTREIPEQQGIKTREIGYLKYSFIHYDVMGSGRFFYAVNAGEITVEF